MSDKNINDLVEGFSFWKNLASVLPIDDEAEERVSEFLAENWEEPVYRDINDSETNIDKRLVQERKMGTSIIHKIKHKK